MQELHISVRNLVEFIFRAGDIDNRAGKLASAEAMMEGSRIHRKIQKSMDTSYQAEVPLKIEWKANDYVLVVEGRADGIVYGKFQPDLPAATESVLQPEMEFAAHFTSISKSQPPAARTKSFTSSMSDNRITLTVSYIIQHLFLPLNKILFLSSPSLETIMPLFFSSVKVPQTLYFLGFSCIMTVNAQPFYSDSYRFFSCIYIYTCYLMQFLQKIAFPITKTGIF